jgi:hypothetical protein
MAIWMAWVRKNLQFGSWLALTALAIQLILSFGHIHADDLRPATSVQQAVDADHDGSSQTDRYGLGHHDCDICATIALLATLVVPSPPALAVLSARSVERLVFVDTHQRPVNSERPFEARAPPYA